MLVTSLSRNLDPVKGVAIVSIILYHFSRLLFDRPKTVQWFFLEGQLQEWIARLPEYTLLDYIVGPFLHFGFIGVHIFVICSGIGLGLSLVKHGLETFSIQTFFNKRIRRIIPLYWISLFVFYGIDIILNGWKPIIGIEIPLKMLGFFFLLPNQSFYSVNSVWWFFGMIFQLYLLFPFIVFLLKRVSPLLILAGSFVVSVSIKAIFLYNLIPSINRFYPGGAIGIVFLFPFVLGIFLCMTAERNPHCFTKLFKTGTLLLILGISSVGICYSLYSKSLYVFWDVFISLFSLSLTMLLVPAFPKVIRNIFSKAGEWSIYIFLFHQPILVNLFKFFQ
jgi:peptidoglycan/LPS O-acetylase OafA/YrhL